jgi:FlaA1/EpsC-like NDP-sugar epimerase
VNKSFHLTKPHHLLRTTQLAILDIVIFVTAYSVIYVARIGATARMFLGALPAILLAALITFGFMYMFGVYHRIWERTSGHGITVILKPITLVTAILLVQNAVVSPRWIPLSVIIIANTFALGGFVAIRYRSRLIDGLSWRWKAIWHRKFPVIMPTTRVLIVGAGHAGQMLALRLRQPMPDRMYQVVGFVDDDSSKQGLYVEGYPVLGKRESIGALVEAQEVDLIAVAMHSVKGQDFREILQLCEQTKALIKVVPDIFGMIDPTKAQPLRDVRPEDLIGRSMIERHSSVDLTAVQGKRVLVTGAAGSIGSELCRQLLHYEPVQLLMVDNNESGLYDLEMELRAAAPSVDLKPILCDVTDEAGLGALFTTYQPQVIFHAAAYKHVPMLERYPQEALRVNIAGTYNLARLALRHGVERFVLISTDKAINPNSVMGASKRVCEVMLQVLQEQCRDSCQTLFTSVRFGNVLGSRGSVVPLFSRQIDMGGPITVTDREMTRYFMSIPEAVNLVIHAACLTAGGDIFFLRMGEVVRIVDLAERMIRLRGMRPGVDIQITFSGIRPGEKMHEQLIDESELLTDTVHPHIVRVRSQQEMPTSEPFEQCLRQLLKGGFATDAPLVELQALIAPVMSVSPQLTPPLSSVVQA